jgi:hypothetical protein
MSIDAKRLVRLLVMEFLVVLFFAVVMCAGCATVPDYAIVLPAGCVIRTADSETIQTLAGPNAKACYMPELNTIFVNKYTPDAHLYHECLHAAGYRHGANWPEGTDTPIDMKVLK